ncbi:MAG TPA: PhzF family phenazine biosynthesis protein [Terriglobia bacterium]|nr:PhzF family phenazine biosynthesis protein [Terriglobia bacterium]
MGIQIVQVDAFTDVPFHGNPAAVCFLDETRDDAWMQSVAREMNLSETAFLRARGDGPGEIDLRWFTPAAEVDLCGHATLASAHALWESGRLAAEVAAHFHTRSGVLIAERRGDWIELDFPSLPEQPATPPPELRSALSVTPVYVGLSRFDYLVELGSEASLRALRPDFAGLRRVPGRGVIVTSQSESPEYDFVSRYFAPNYGIDEDPVTGSAHCVLAPYWARKLGRPTLTGYQASARGGVVLVRLDGDRVRLGGRAVTVLRGELV